MKTRNFRNRLLSTAIIAGAAGLLLPASAMAQDDVERVDAGSGDADEAVARQETIVVTGSLIPQTGNLVETSPVTEIGAEDFDIRGALRAEDIINTLPQAFGAQGSNLANGATGTASVNLRGLGSERTLVLMNGRRLPYGSLNTPAADINFIPSQLVKRVDILTGGASATYGSDAVSGVVNFVLNDEFEGVRIDSNYSFYQHNNDGELQGLLKEFAAINPSQYRVPSGSTIDGEAIDITAMMGGEFDNGRGHIMAFAGYQNTNEVLQGDRDYAQCALGTRNDGSEFTCSGSSTNQFTNLLDTDGSYAIPGAVAANTLGEEYTAPAIWGRVDPDGSGQFIPRNFTSDTFNFNPFNHYQRPNERYNFGAFGRYDITENIEAYTELMFMDNRTNSQIAPSGVFGLGVNGSSGGVNCNNPFLSAQQVQYLCGEIADDTINRRRNADGELIDMSGNVLAEDDDTFYPDQDNLPDQMALGPDGIAPILNLRRNVEGGPRNNDIRHTTWRGVMGIRGDLEGTSIGYDVSASFANVHRSEVYNNDLSISRIQKALFAVENDAGDIVCSVNADDDPTNDDPACVPYDIFSGNAPDPAAVNYIVSPLNRDGETTQTIINARLFGSMGDWGIQSPMAMDAPGFALGAEYRRDTLDSNPDVAFQSGDGAGQGGPTNPISGAQNVIDVFGELNVPLIQDRPGIETLGFDLAYRKSFYDEVDSDSYKVGLDYAPTSDIRFRASYQRAVRAANVFELFDPQGIGLFDLTANDAGIYDPCAGTSPEYTQAQCANTGVTADQYGSIADNPAGQFNTLTGGNPNLEPESSDTYTFGFVATPTMIDGLTVSVDYFDITVEDYINTVPQELALDTCALSGDDFFCSLVNRGNGGTLWANPTGFITATNINTGQISTSGIDVLANYVYDAGGIGVFDFDFVGTWLESLEVQPLPDASVGGVFDCAGFYGGRCQSNFGSGANPEWRHKASVTWGQQVWSLTGTWRYYDEVTLDGTNGGGINGTLDAQNYFDLAGRYQALENVSLRAGVNNVTDEDPPLSSVVGTAPGNGNTYPQVYDAMGRYIFLGATVDF